MAWRSISWLAAISNMPPRARMETLRPLLPKGRVGTLMSLAASSGSVLTAVVALDATSDANPVGGTHLDELATGTLPMILHIVLLEKWRLSSNFGGGKFSAGNTMASAINRSYQLKTKSTVVQDDVIRFRRRPEWPSDRAPGIRARRYRSRCRPGGPHRAAADGCRC